MDPNHDYLEKNRLLWNARTDVHVDSDFYGMADFLAGKSSLNAIELGLLGDLEGKSVLHLQCHFGQDSISLARMGAEVTGADLSDKAIEKARELALQTNTNPTFICTDLYELPQHLDKKFDVVFTSYGTIGWLPDLDKWAKVIAHFLKPGGRFVFAEFHPVVWMFDDNLEKVTYGYFNSGPIIETETGTYADRKAPLNHEYVGWNHDLGEVLSSLLQNGLALESFQEFDYSPYNIFRNPVEVSPGKFRVAHLDGKIPLVYALTARK
ncbi:class I SAM-dependent methyltransferase [Adhaeribacter sp. BT258]|uniref:Class I SAM-dependent methyltransferase n=1 Tax=Adhaeribacter terrigena TaxID=2793070 RepID=A0ABS1C4R3_9BACT|nr:class I SAM-dependent methyltransferase [Adhaeribacter terrigena]MBK0403520.1 class I SAM-dependent methyltransferase [Adhaeribacter terrigena]